MLQTIQAILADHGFEIALSVVSFALGSWIGQWRGQREFARRAFFDRVNVSLNYVHEGEFRIRTLTERAGSDVFRNAHMLRRVMRAAQRTTLASPLLDLRESDYWYYLNAVLNLISEQFAEGYVREEAGLSPRGETYLLFLTSETDREVRQRKVRAMVIRESVLVSTLAETPAFRNDFQKARWDSLKSVAEEWRRTNGSTSRIREVAICV